MIDYKPFRDYFRTLLTSASVLPTDGYVEMVSVKTSNLSVTVQHDGAGSATGICYVVDDGTVVYTKVAADTNLVLTIPHNSGTAETIKIWSATSFYSGRVGNLTTLDCNTNSITSLLATGINLSNATDCTDNQLDEAALIAFVNSLATTTTGTVDYTGNPGTDNFADWLATGDDKGYDWTPPATELGYLTMVSSKTSDINVTLRHDGVDGASGVNYQVDSDPIVYTAGAAGASIALAIPHNSGSPETIRNWSATSASSSRVGNLTYINCNSNAIYVLDVSSLTALTQLYCGNNSIPELDVSSLTSLAELHCYNNSISELNISSLTNLEYLYCYSNSISLLDVSSLTALTLLHCASNSISVLDVSSLTALTYLACYSNSISLLDVSSLTALTQLRCDNNSISELIAAGQDMSSTNNDIGDNNLDEAALIAFANSLGTTTTGVIYYGGNPGSAAFETWLLTGDDKGYIWINS